jgi:hypothetical protein
MALYDPEGYRHPERQSLERIVAAYDRLILVIQFCDAETLSTRESGSPQAHNWIEEMVHPPPQTSIVPRRSGQAKDVGLVLRT